MRYETAQLVFWLFAGLVGLSISYIFAVFTGVSIAQTFFTGSEGSLGQALTAHSG
jgi:hypothetical protein